MSENGLATALFWWGNGFMVSSGMVAYVQDSFALVTAALFFVGSVLSLASFLPAILYKPQK